MRSPKFVAAVLMGALLGGGARKAEAISLRLKNMSDDSPAVGLSFGGVNAISEHYHTAQQYLEITHTDSRFRKVYLYTDNGTAFGRSEEGMVNVSSMIAGVPLRWKSFPSHPDFFSAGNEGEWTLLLEKTRPEFGDTGVKEARARVLPEADGISRVGLALRTDGSTPGGQFTSRLVIEETSDVADIQGPVVAHKPYQDIILINIPIGLQTPADDDGSVVSSTFYFRMEGTGPFVARSPTLIPSPSDPFHWTVQTELNPGDVRPGVLEYYFSVRDGFDNETRTATYRVNLVPVDETVSRSVTMAGGSIQVPVGDPRLPGFSVEFPSRSLNKIETFQVTLKPSNHFPPFNNQPVVRVFDLGPSGVRFGRPVTIVLPYLDQDQDGVVDGTSVNEKDLRIFWFDGHQWLFAGGQVDPVANQVRTQVAHFSVYGLAPLAGGLTAEMVRPALKIFSPNGDGVNDFVQFNITGEFELDVFDVRGERVRRQSNDNIWDGRKDDGGTVETGTYVYRLTGQGLTVTGTLAVAR